jgi:alkylated DNA repair protein alkB family protein 6
MEERLAPYAVSEVPSVYYIPDWIEPGQEAEFMAIADGDMNAWEDMATRSTQEWGSGDRSACGRGLKSMPLPPSQQKLADALHHLGVFDGALYPMNSVRINGYRPGQGIYPHCDGPVYYPKVAILSLGTPCIFDFHPKSGTEDCMKWDQQHNVPGGHVGGEPLVSVLLEPRSLLIFGEDAFWHHRHGLEATATDTVTSKVANLHLLGGRYKVGDTIDRTRRVSLTMRHLLPRCSWPCCACKE